MQSGASGDRVGDVNDLCVPALQSDGDILPAPVIEGGGGVGVVRRGESVLADSTQERVGATAEGAERVEDEGDDFTACGGGDIAILC